MSKPSLGWKQEFDLIGTPRRLNSQVELTLYRVAQEGVNECAQHAQARRVEVAPISMNNDKWAEHL